MITEHYLQLNARLHQERPDYGANGARWAQQVNGYALAVGARTAIDYGCGKGSLREKLRRISPLQVTNYDPAILEFAEMPVPADLVICTDVMEHVEPEQLHNVLEHIASLARTAVFMNIACREAKKTLADGRNAHLIVRQPYFWLDTLREYFDIESFQCDPGQVTLTARGLGQLWT